MTTHNVVETMLRVTRFPTVFEEIDPPDDELSVPFWMVTPAGATRLNVCAAATKIEKDNGIKGEGEGGNEISTSPVAAAFVNKLPVRLAEMV